MKTPSKPAGCPQERHDANYSVGISGDNLKIRMKVVGGYCSVGEADWDKRWDNLVGGRSVNILLCEKAVRRHGLDW
jgi:hypothetical protein